jgi:ADP-ribose pyrophosphatase YjhB (NUDIX family)
MGFGASVRTAGYRLALRLLRGWWVVRRPRSSGVRCIIRHGRAILLVRHSYGDRRWMLPGGRVRRGEDPITTARREMRQELDISCPHWKLAGCVAARASYRRQSPEEGFRRHSTFYLQGEVATAAAHPRPGELSDAGWFEIGSLPHDRAESLDLAAEAGWLGLRDQVDGSAPLEQVASPSHAPPGATDAQI